MDAVRQQKFLMPPNFFLLLFSIADNFSTTTNFINTHARILQRFINVELEFLQL